tara:strand:+ start:782 stop:1177 length:396 start_codon:yes stop_codon:yes gene_type:complete
MSDSELNTNPWDQVTVLKKNKVQLQKMNTKNSNINKPKVNYSNNLIKLEQNDTIVKQNKVPLKLGKIIQLKRTEMKLTQNNLAKLLNIDKNIINQLETGKSVKNTQVLSKLERVLKIKLLGKPENIGKSLN